MALAFVASLASVDAAFAQYTITLQPNSLPAVTENSSYNQTITAVGGVGTYDYSLVVPGTGPLPPGLSLTVGGVLSGTPTVPGSYSFTIDATDDNNVVGFRDYTLSIGADGSLNVTPASLPDGETGVGYSETISATGGSGSYNNFTVTAGSLPNGLSLNSGNGAITGTPTAGGTFNFTIRVRDTDGNTGSRAYSVDIDVILTVNPASLPNGTVGTSYSQNLSASGGAGGYTFAVTGGALPAGLTLTAGGLLSGTPTTSGPTNFTVEATDSSSNTGDRTYNVTINPAPITLSPSSLPTGLVGSAYNQTVTASGGTGPYTYAVVAGSLPTGLSMSAGGVISGTPTTAATYNFTVQATDSTPNTGTRAYTVSIGTSGSVTITPAALPAGTQGLAYNQTLAGSGGTGPYTFSLSAGALPAGLSMSGAGVISGTPTAGGSSFTVAAVDSIGNTGSRPYTLAIGTSSLSLRPTTLPNGTRGVAYSQRATASGGTGPYTYSISAGALPAGLALASNGIITGTPTATGTSTFTIRALDSAGNTATRAYSMRIGTVSITVGPATLPAAVVGSSYSQRIRGTGGVAPYTFSITVGSLPPGLTLNASSGVISGRATSASSASFTVQVMDSQGNIGTRAYVLVNRPDPAADAEVQGVIKAQSATALRFATTQMGHIARRLETLHTTFDPCSVAFGIAPAMQPAPPPIYNDPGALYSPNTQYGVGALGYAGAPVYGPPAQAYGPLGYPPQPQQQQVYQPAPVYAPQAVYAPPAPAYAPAPPPVVIAQPGPRPDLCPSQMAFWTSGSFQFGSMTPDGQAAGNSFNTSGLTAGVDWRASNALIIGAAIGVASDRTDIGDNGSQVKATGFNAALYASLRPYGPVFLDGTIGFGSLGFDNRRWITADNAMASGNRDGSIFFGGLTAGLELGQAGMKFAPYVGIDFVSVKLDGYSEDGSSAQLLTYEDTSFSATSGTLGLRASIDVPTQFGLLTPMARIEYRHTAQGGFDQLMYYSDLGAGTGSTFTQDDTSGGVTTAALGLRMRAVSGLAAEIEYTISSGAESLWMQSIRLSLLMPF